MKSKEETAEYQKQWRLKHRAQINQNVKDWYISHPEKKKTKHKKSHRRYFLKKLYGISQENYNDMLLQQLYGCSICGKTEMDNGIILSVDHNHETGKVRALLCRKCNWMLGNADDSSERLRKAADYIDAHKNKKGDVSNPFSLS